MSIQDSYLIQNKLESAERRLKKCNTLEEKIAMINYILGISETYSKHLSSVSMSDLYLYSMVLHENKEKYINNFVSNNDKHFDYFSNVTKAMENDFTLLFNYAIHNHYNGFYENSFSKDDVLYLLESFFKEYELDSFFHDLYKNHNIHFVSSDVLTDSHLGFALYNPVRKNTELFMKSYPKTTFDMAVMVHELGHAFDFNQFAGNHEKWLDFSTLTSHTEVISTLFERLWNRYLLKNGVASRDVSTQYINFLYKNYVLLLCSNALGLINYDSMKEGQIDEKITDEFLKAYRNKYFCSQAKELLKEVNFLEIHKYAYGNIISLLMCDDVEKNGFSSKLLKQYFENRVTPCSQDLLQNMNFSSEQCIKTYKKELKLVQK